MFINSLFFVFGVETERVPSVRLYFEANEVFPLHAADQSSEWNTFYSRSVLTTVSYQIFIADYIAFFKTEKLNIL
jgi:hypothetical protein